MPSTKPGWYAGLLHHRPKGNSRQTYLSRPTRWSSSSIKMRLAKKHSERLLIRQNLPRRRHSHSSELTNMVRRPWTHKTGHPSYTQLPAQEGWDSPNCHTDKAPTPSRTSYSHKRLRRHLVIELAPSYCLNKNSTGKDSVQTRRQKRAPMQSHHMCRLMST